jgi:cell division FtsZ-interacting protein ZapD
MVMLQQLLSVTQAAERLRVRPEYVQELVKKQRLTFIQGEQLDADQVEKLATLMDKLRNNGIATLVQIVDEKGSLESD